MADRYRKNRKKIIAKNLAQYGIHTCEICGKAPLYQHPMNIKPSAKGWQVPDLLTIDHIVPISKGGKDGLYNLQVACRECNIKKGNT